MAIQDGQHDWRNRGALSSWFRGASASLGCGTTDRCDGRDDSAVATLSPLSARGLVSARGLGQAPGEVSAPEVRGLEAVATSGVLVPFPIHGEALLVKLADVLRNRLANPRSERDPLLLKMSRDPTSRLAIDDAAYVEFLSDQATYHVVIEAGSDTKVMLDTTDFDTLVRFVAQYVTERPAELATLEAVS